ncbi:lipocalin family protein [Reichenbachiella carrageenanivorans]|uniref:Lipocalin family protein n=1 Tax=Reichenbachiella carrageenanivorans TaxID=2979869 RepID=A0ABY6D1K3_9BACT|nr:lipocalin family protein [Reichenbachiella carrageenanivorans]UXX80050.1 lipocalin family protein [Reichenbachiella carrageenanivorans]
MKNYRKYIWICLLVFWGCSVVTEDGEIGTEAFTFDDSFPASAIDAYTYLLGGASRTWITVAFTIDGVNGVQKCRLDDQIVLKDDQTYAYDGGNTLCGAEDDQKTKSGTWLLETSTRTLTFDEGTDRESQFFIESLTDKEIVVSSHYYSWKVMGKFAHE